MPWEATLKLTQVSLRALVYVPRDLGRYALSGRLPFMERITILGEGQSRWRGPRCWVRITVSGDEYRLG